jgi:hypothetical protein
MHSVKALDREQSKSLASATSLSGMVLHGAEGNFELN